MIRRSLFLMNHQDAPDGVQGIPCETSQHKKHPWSRRPDLPTLHGQMNCRNKESPSNVRPVQENSQQSDKPLRKLHQTDQMHLKKRGPLGCSSSLSSGRYSRALPWAAHNRSVGAPSLDLDSTLGQPHTEVGRRSPRSADCLVAQNCSLPSEGW